MIKQQQTMILSAYAGIYDIVSYPKVKEKLNLLNETLEDDNEHLKISSDADAKIARNIENEYIEHFKRLDDVIVCNKAKHAYKGSMNVN